MRSTSALSARTTAECRRQTITRPFCRPGHPRLSSAMRFMAALMLLASTLGAAGCTAVGPDFTKPSAPVAANWSEKDNPQVKSESGDYSQWWTVFEDEVLNNLIRIAYENNPDLQVAGLRILEARAQLGIALGNQFPQKQQGNAAYTYTRNSENAANTAGGGDLRYGAYNYGIDASWEIDFWGKYKRGIESADAGLTASVADYDSALVSLAGNVASTYIQIRTYEERLKVARENVEIQKESLRLTEVRYRNGAVTELDVQQARTLLYDTQAQIPSLEISLQQSRNSLAVLLGMPPGDLTGLLGDEPGTIPTPPAEVVLGIPAELLRRRPDIRSAELQAAAQCAQIGIAKAELFPRISLLGSFGFLASDSRLTRTGGSGFTDLFTWSSYTMTTGPTIEWPILNYGRITNNVRVQDARFEQLMVTYRNTVLSAAKDVEDALVGFLRSQDKTALLEESVKAAKRAVDLAMLQYREGAVDFTTVLNSQQSLVQEQDSLTQSRGAVPTNLVALYKGLGGGWELRAGKDFIPAETVRVMRERTNWGDLLPVKGGLPADLEPPPPSNVRELPRPPDW